MGQSADTKSAFPKHLLPQLRVTQARAAECWALPRVRPATSSLFQVLTRWPSHPHSSPGCVSSQLDNLDPSGP